LKLRISQQFVFGDRRSMTAFGEFRTKLFNGSA